MADSSDAALTTVASTHTPVGDVRGSRTQLRSGSRVGNAHSGSDQAIRECFRAA